MLSGRFGAREGLAPVNEVAVTDPLDLTISTVYDAEDRVLAQRGTTYPGSGKYKGSSMYCVKGVSEKSFSEAFVEHKRG